MLLGEQVLSEQLRLQELSDTRVGCPCSDRGMGKPNQALTGRSQDVDMATSINSIYIKPYQKI